MIVPNVEGTQIHYHFGNCIKYIAYIYIETSAFGFFLRKINSAAHFTLIYLFIFEKHKLFQLQMKLRYVIYSSFSSSHPFAHIFLVVPYGIW